MKSYFHFKFIETFSTLKEPKTSFGMEILFLNKLSHNMGKVQSETKGALQDFDLLGSTFKILGKNGSLKLIFRRQQYDVHSWFL